MNVVDSSAWLEYFMDGPNADHFAAVIEDAPNLVVPSICLYEVLKQYLRREEKLVGLERVSAMRGGRVIDLNTGLALQAAELSAKYRLAMADSIIYAVACQQGAQLWTQDQDFEGLPGVNYVAKHKA